MVSGGPYTHDTKAIGWTDDFHDTLDSPMLVFKLCRLYHHLLYGRSICLAAVCCLSGFDFRIGMLTVLLLDVRSLPSFRIAKHNERKITLGRLDYVA